MGQLFRAMANGHMVRDAIQANNRNADQSAEMRDLQDQFERTTLLNQALWELLRERVQLTDEDLLAKAQEIDMRDGVADDKMTPTAVRCPSCKRVCNSRHAKCIYCGQPFEKPVFG
jgi:hypothetical protein